MFEKDKENTLNKLKQGDKSTKGFVDKKIKPLISLINKHPNFYTTSSCAGRILLLEGESKKTSKWHFVSHDPIKEEELKNCLTNLNPTETLWFRQEPLILHICCRTIEDAQKLLEIIGKVGLTHSGITGTKPKIIIEIRGNEFLITPITKENNLRLLIQEANKKLNKTQANIKKIYAAFSRFLT